MEEKKEEIRKSVEDGSKHSFLVHMCPEWERRRGFIVMGRTSLASNALVRSLVSAHNLEAQIGRFAKTPRTSRISRIPRDPRFCEKCKPKMLTATERHALSHDCDRGWSAKQSATLQVTDALTDARVRLRDLNDLIEVLPLCRGSQKRIIHCACRRLQLPWNKLNRS